MRDFYFCGWESRKEEGGRREKEVQGCLLVVSMAEGSFTQKVATLPRAVIFPRRDQQWSALLGECSHRLSRAHAFPQPPAQEARK